MSQSQVAAIHGATTVEADDAALIREATIELLRTMLDSNGVSTGQIISAIFTVTTDLRSEFPARAARELGWHNVPLLCMAGAATADGIERCIRVLLHVNVPVGVENLRHPSLRGAKAAEG